MKNLAGLTATIALAAGLAACSSSSGSPGTPTAKAVASQTPASPTSGTETIYGKATGRAVIAGNPVVHLTFTGPVATSGTAALGSTPRKGGPLTFRTAAGTLAVIYGRVGAPAGRLVSAKTCRVVVKLTVVIRVDGASSTGKFAGAAGAGKAVGVVSGNLPKLSDGTCDESNTAQPTARTAVATFTATLKLTVKK
jgi:hypothetical protein